MTRHHDSFSGVTASVAYPRIVPAGATGRITVSLSRPGGTAAPGLDLTAFIQPGPAGIAVEPPDVLRLHLAPGATDVSASLTISGKPMASTARLRLRFLAAGVPVGGLVLPVRVDPRAGATVERTMSRRLSVPIAPPPAPDFLVFVTATGGPIRSFSVTTVENRSDGTAVPRDCGSFSPYPNDRDRRSVATLVEMIGGTTAEKGVGQFWDLGGQLWAFLPTGFRALFGDGPPGTDAPLRGASGSMLIVTDDWPFPWELVVPPAHGEATPRALGQQFAISRCADGRALHGSIRIDGVACLASALVDETMFENRPDAAREMAAVQQLARALRARTFLELTGGAAGDVVDAIADPGVQLLHIRTHGSGSDLTLPSLDGRDKALTPGDLRSVRRRRGGSPLIVFLNACRSGVVGARKLEWEEVLERCGVSVLVATLWAVDFDAMATVAERFYLGREPHAHARPFPGLVDGAGLAETLREIRRDPHLVDAAGGTVFNPTFLAYVASGHPNAVVR